LRAEALVERARLLMLAGVAAKAASMATEGLALSEELGIERLQASALVTRGATGDGATAAADLTRGIEIADRSKSLTEYFRGLNNLAEHHLKAAELPKMQPIYAQMRAEETELGLTVQLRWTDGQDTWLQYLIGDWDRALELAIPLIDDAEAGRPHYLAAGAYAQRSQIRDARSDPSAPADLARALELGRQAGDPQALGPILALAARQRHRHGADVEALKLLAEAEDVMLGVSQTGYQWNDAFVLAFAHLDARERYRALLLAGARNPWVDAALAVCDRDSLRAIEMYERFGAVTLAAEVRLIAAAELKAQGDHAAAAAQAAPAAAFFAARGASLRVREAELYLAASA
jgi:hypothetical protein